MERPAANLFKKEPVSNTVREYNFINLLGEKKSFCLVWEERLIETTCPICGNHIVAGNDGYMTKWVYCPSCDFDTRGLTIAKYKEMVDENLKNHIEEQKRLNELIDKEIKTIGVLKGKLKQKNG